MCRLSGRPDESKQEDPVLDQLLDKIESVGKDRGSLLERLHRAKAQAYPRDVAEIHTSRAGFYKIIELAETVTIDKYGPKADIQVGELAKIMGIPIKVVDVLFDDIVVIFKYGSTRTLWP